MHAVLLHYGKYSHFISFQQVVIEFSLYVTAAVLEFQVAHGSCTTT